MLEKTIQYHDLIKRPKFAPVHHFMSGWCTGFDFLSDYYTCKIVCITGDDANKSIWAPISISVTSNKSAPYKYEPKHLLEAGIYRIVQTNRVWNV